MSRKKKQTRCHFVAGSEPKPRSMGQQDYYDALLNKQLVIADGPAGCGKTLFASYFALKAYFEGEVNKIVIGRPAKEACQEKIGFIPGTVSEKMQGYITPVLENFRKLAGIDVYNSMWRSNDIEIVPLAFMRGRDFDKKYVIIEEAQNCNLDQFKMILTRITDKSRMVISGDTEQNDIGDECCLEKVASKLEGMENFAYIALEDEDIVRSKYISEILIRLDGIDA